MDDFINKKTEFTVDEDLAVTLRLSALNQEEHADRLHIAGAPRRLIEHAQEVARRMRWVAQGLEQGWLGDVRGPQVLELDLTDYDQVTGQ